MADGGSGEDEGQYAPFMPDEAVVAEEISMRGMQREKILGTPIVWGIFKDCESLNMCLATNEEPQFHR